MKPCDYSRFCGKRMAHGDRLNGCSSVDQAVCDPTLSTSVPTPTAPPAPPPMVRCVACARERLAADARGKSCECGSWKWAAKV